MLREMINYFAKEKLFINNVNVGIVTDSDYKSGQVALFAHLDRASQEVSISFNKVEIDKLKKAWSVIILLPSSHAVRKDGADDSDCWANQGNDVWAKPDQLVV